MTTRQGVALAVLLSTCNGERYLSEQLDSLLRQTYRNFRIVVRDDGSGDSTAAILQRYHSRHPRRLHWLQAKGEPLASDNRNLGASAAFSFLMQYALANKAGLGLRNAYLMLCDQDDVWFPDKIERQMQCMRQTEDRTRKPDGKPPPILIHGDLQVVSEDRLLLADSLVRFQGLNTQRNRFCHIVINNLVTGCTALLNEALAVRALPVPAQAIMHDWWLAMVAGALGELVFMDEPLVQYRQHQHNTLGAKRQEGASRRRLHWLGQMLSLTPDPHLQQIARQAMAFADRYGAELSSHDLGALRRSARMKNALGFLQCLAYLCARRC